MQMITNRLERVDIYSAEVEKDGYIGTKPKPVLLGFVYADIQPVTEETFEERGGKVVKKQVKLIARSDAGVKCGDMIAVRCKSPNFRITEIRRYSTHSSVTAVTI